MLTTNVQGNVTSLPQGLTLIQRPGQQPQLVQLQRPQTQIPRIITNPQQQVRPQIILQQKPQTIITQQTSQQPTQQIIQVQQPAQQQPQRMQRKGVAIPVRIIKYLIKFNLKPNFFIQNEHFMKAHEVFKKANLVSRPDKALILGFISGIRENPRPSAENVIDIKLGESEVNFDDDKI